MRLAGRCGRARRSGCEYTAAGHLTFNARSGKHDDLVLALAIAIWRAHGGGMACYGIFEYYRLLATGGNFSDPRYVIGVDLGQSRDATAITVVRRIEVPAGELATPPEPFIARGG